MGSLCRSLLLALVAAGCTPAAGGPALPDAGARAAALARLTVENRTERPLTIAFLAAGAPDGPVVVGDVAPLSTRALAPIPAGEPIVLVARAPDGAEYRLAPRSFEPDAAWSWVIPPDAPFRRPRPGGGPP